MREQDLYPEIAHWLSDFLTHKYKNALKNVVNITATRKISDFLREHNALHYFPEGETYEVKVDITGLTVLKSQKAFLSLIEVKLHQISISEYSQLLGYAKIIIPEHAFIVSPQGWSSSLHRLIKSFNRLDILEYAPHKTIYICKWDINCKEVKFGDCLFKKNFFPKF